MEFRDHLVKKILPFWMGLSDDEFGGFYGYVDRNLKVKKDAHKGCILNSRLLWTFSSAGRILKDKRYIAYAKRAYEFMEAFWDRENGGVFWSVAFDGKPLDLTKHTYCQAFAVYGLSAYYRATGETGALEKAFELFRIIEEKCADEGGYGEAYKADFSPKSNEKLSENGVMASRTMNTLLHVLEAYAELYRASGDEKVRTAGEMCLERFLNVMYNPEKMRLEVFYDREYRSLIDMQSFGHDIEASWLMWDAVLCMIPDKKRAPYREMCIALAEAVHARAMTDHGLKNEMVNGEIDETRIWWVQAETVMGFENAYALTGDEKYRRAAETQWNAVKRMIVDPRETGEWFWSVLEDGQPTDKPVVEEWKCPYHNGRMCLRMIDKKQLIRSKGDPMAFENCNYVIATDYMRADGKCDVSDAIQKLIDANPNRTIFFPDGVYLIKKPVQTSSDSRKSVDLVLSNFAHFLAAPDWNSDEAMIRLGAKDNKNNLDPGCNYSVTGGIIDCAGVAKGISIDGGRETRVEKVNIKNASVGLHIKYGANNASSDSDIMNVNITGNGKRDSVGVLIEGFDNTLTNMRIANVFTGVVVKGGGNMLRNIHPLLYMNDVSKADYEKTAGFLIQNPMNWFDYCYSDQYAAGFDTTGGGIFKNCFSWWYSGDEEMHVALKCRGPFFGSVDTFVLGGKCMENHPNRFAPEETEFIGTVREVVRVSDDGNAVRIL